MRNGARRGVRACAILGDDVMVVPDARADPRFAVNPLVADASFIRVYAGVPLTMPDGHDFGTRCIFDPEPRREGMCLLVRRHLAMFARIVIDRPAARRIQLERDAECRALQNAADRPNAAAATPEDRADALAALACDSGQKSGEAAQGADRPAHLIGPRWTLPEVRKLSRRLPARPCRTFAGGAYGSHIGPLGRLERNRLPNALSRACRHVLEWCNDCNA